jgi:hypothetical protein
MARRRRAAAVQGAFGTGIFMTTSDKTQAKGEKMN